jgi:hypothetical protein
LACCRKGQSKPGAIFYALAAPLKPVAPADFE